MAATPNAAFKEFRSRLALTTAQRKLLTNRQAAIYRQLTVAFGRSSNMRLLRLARIGSTDRGTVIRPPTDLDLMAVFDADQVWNTYRNDSRLCLYRVRAALARYGRVEVVGARGQAARLFYVGGAQADVAPMFVAKGGGFLLPDGRGGWLLTDPDVHRQWARQRDAALNFRMKPMVRMLKAWNRAHSLRLASFHLEVMVGSLFASMSNSSRRNTQLFFRGAPRFLRVEDPAGYSGDLSAGISSQQRQTVLRSFRLAADRATRAIDAERRGDYREAIRLWRITYGASFPAFR